MTMKNNHKITIFLVLTLNILGLTYTECKNLPVLALSAREVYRLLRQAGQQDAIPEGRVITQGLAAMTGFALGLKKTLAVVMLYDVITANVTDLDLGIVNAVNSANSANSVNSVTDTSASVATRQEFCFNSRNARNLKEAAVVAEIYEWLDNHENRKMKKISTRRGKSYRNNGGTSRQVTITLTNPTITADSAISDLTSRDENLTSNNPTTTTTVTEPTTDDKIGTGIGIETTIATTTDTGADTIATHCVAIER